MRKLSRHEMIKLVKVLAVLVGVSTSYIIGYITGLSFQQEKKYEVIKKV